MFERLETLEELILAGTREAGARNNFAQQVIYRSTLITFKAVRLCSPVSLSLQNLLYTNINSTTTLVHRTTVHM